MAPASGSPTDGKTILVGISGAVGGVGAFADISVGWDGDVDGTSGFVAKTASDVGAGADTPPATAPCVEGIDATGFMGMATMLGDVTGINDDP